MLDLTLEEISRYVFGVFSCSIIAKLTYNHLIVKLFDFGFCKELTKKLHDKASAFIYHPNQLSFGINRKNCQKVNLLCCSHSKNYA